MFLWYFLACLSYTDSLWLLYYGMEICMNQSNYLIVDCKSNILHVMVIIVSYSSLTNWAFNIAVARTHMTVTYVQLQLMRRHQFQCELLCWWQNAVDKSTPLQASNSDVHWVIKPNEKKAVSTPHCASWREKLFHVYHFSWCIRSTYGALRVA